MFRLTLACRPPKTKVWPRLRGISTAEREHASTRRNNIRKSPFPRQDVEDDTAGDFRPPWVYRASGFLIYTTIPITLLYCVFIADYGEREHVFSPVRRWAQKYKDSGFSLSPEEAALAKQQNALDNAGTPPRTT